MEYKELKNKIEKDILELLSKYQGEWAFWWDDNALSFHSDNSKHYIVPKDVSKKIVHVIFRRLYRKGLIGGCDCGCRGDFEITDKGLALLGVPRNKPYGGY